MCNVYKQLRHNRLETQGKAAAMGHGHSSFRVRNVTRLETQCQVACSRDLNSSRASGDLRAPDAADPEWKIALQAGVSGYPLTLTWDPLLFPPGGWFLTNLDGTQTIAVAMASQGTVVITDPTVTTLSITTSATVSLQYGAA